MLKRQYSTRGLGRVRRAHTAPFSRRDRLEEPAAQSGPGYSRSRVGETDDRCCRCRLSSLWPDLSLPIIIRDFLRPDILMRGLGAIAVQLCGVEAGATASLPDRPRPYGTQFAM